MKTAYYTINIKKNVSFRIVQLSDLHKKVFGTGNSELIKAAAALKPDAFFLTGDMVSRSVKDFENLKPLITELNKTAPGYYALGNRFYGNSYQRWKIQIAKTLGDLRETLRK